MNNSLLNLRKHTILVADTGDIEKIRLINPKDATTNPSIIMSHVNSPYFKGFFYDALTYAKSKTRDPSLQTSYASDYFLVCVGTRILSEISGRISTEIDSRLSFNTDKTIVKAIEIIDLYSSMGVKKDRVLIKIAATWEGIKAAEYLEEIGIHCNLTLIFSFEQAKACAESNVFLISPFVGRITDWFKENAPENFNSKLDPGVDFVKSVFYYYKKMNYKTIVMAASFRNTDQIKALCGCDYLTISPALIQELMDDEETLEKKLFGRHETVEANNEIHLKITKEQFHTEMNKNVMAKEKLRDGIDAFSKAQEELELIFMNLLKK